MLSGSSLEESKEGERGKVRKMEKKMLSVGLVGTLIKEGESNEQREEFGDADSEECQPIPPE